MIKVTKKGKEPLEKLLKRFNKRCEKDGLIKDIKKNEYYESPSAQKRRKKRKMLKEIEKEKRFADR